MKFELEEYNRDIPESDLIEDLRNAERSLRRQGKKLTYRSYTDVGKYSAATYTHRFGTWNNALIKAGLSLTEEKNISVGSLFENLRMVWLQKGKQPVYRDMAFPPSRYSASIYVSRFGSWRKSLKEFVDFVQSDNWLNDEGSKTDIALENKPIPSSIKKRRTSRNISERMRFRILLRDGFSCQTCGASPIKDRGVELHVDHIVPLVKGRRDRGRKFTDKM